MKRVIIIFNKFHILRKTLYFILIVCLTLLVVFIADYRISKYIEQEIQDRITLINAKAESIQVTLFRRTLKVKSLEWASNSDSSNLRQHSLRVKTLTARGISLYELFINNTIQFDKVTIDSGKFQFDRSSSSIFPKPGNLASPTFKFQTILLNAIETQVTLDSLVSFYALLNCTLKDLSIAKKEASKVDYRVKSLEGTINKVNISRQQGLYGLTIANILFNTDTGIITIDSTLLIPNYKKYKFAHRAEGQSGRINISIPQVRMTGIDFKQLADTICLISKIEINSFDLYYFKDKRFALSLNNKPLPMVNFLKLPYSIRVDTIQIRNSHLVYEEFPKAGIESGSISFNNIQATLTNLNNRIRKDEPIMANLQATALLMNSGRINANFQFPLDGSLTYRAQGTISELPFSKLNPILKSIVDVRVESGYLNLLTFNFNYTDRVSKGLMQVDYEDLHVIILNKNKESTNSIKTLIVNVFVKGKIDQSQTKVQRSAVIDIERDRTKSIFNVWSKSVLDGLKRSMLGGFVRKDKKRKSAEVTKRNKLNEISNSVIISSSRKSFYS